MLFMFIVFHRMRLLPSDVHRNHQTYHRLLAIDKKLVRKWDRWIIQYQGFLSILLFEFPSLEVALLAVDGAGNIECDIPLPVLSQRLIFSLQPEVRSRLNGLFMSIFFLGVAVGSFFGGWSVALWIGIAFPTIALLYFATEK